MMASQKELEKSSQPSEVVKFYEGKSLFITGAAGFLGSLLLETLLRLCPGINRIYILIRPKKGVQPEDRKEAIFKKEIFFKIKEQNPDALKKVVVISGDVTHDDLGMSSDDLYKVCQEVSIVFHCAAAISFLRPLSFMIQQNAMATNNIIDLCKKLKKLDVFVYTSTAYSNSNHFCDIEERIYKLPFPAEEVLKGLKNCSEDELMSLYNKCDPKFPNFYTFSKCITENLIAEKAADIPICIIRPSMIVSCCKGILPGYVEDGSGLTSLALGIGKGLIRVLHVDPDKKTNLVPVDIVANNHVVAAAYQQTLESLPSPYVYNSVSGDSATYTWGEVTKFLFAMVLKYPLPKSFQKPSVRICKSGVMYRIFSIFEHYAPAVVIDSLLFMSGHKPRLLKLYRFYDRSVASLKHFTLHEWTFKSDNVQSLYEKLNTTDKDLFPLDLNGFNLEEMAERIRTGAPMYKKSYSDKTWDKKLSKNYLSYYMTSMIKWFMLGGIASVCYIALF